MPSVPSYALRENSRASMCIMRADFTAIERFIKENQGNKTKVQIGLDILVRTMAMVIKGFAQEKSMGPVAPRRRSVPALAYRIPVQRISGRYFSGWQVKRVGIKRFLVYNDAKEAYLIEYGIFMRQRRPILKMSLVSMLRFLEATRTEQRFLDSLIKPRRNALGQYASVPFESRLNTHAILSLTAADLPNRGVNNPNTRGPQGRLPS